MAKTLSISQVRDHLGALVGKVAQRKTRCVITRKGSPAAVLMSLSEYESWEATAELCNDSDELTAIYQGLADLNAGRSSSFEEVFCDDKNPHDQENSSGAKYSKNNC